LYFSVFFGGIRGDEPIISFKGLLESLRDEPDQLIEIILRQAGVIEELRAELQSLKDRIKDLNDRNDGLTAKVTALEQKTARQAAPFRIREQQHKADPQKAGAQNRPWRQLPTDS
jgi:uncharacterized coiled-coil DUF342 family protein